MIEDVPILSINVKIWKFCSVILEHNWRRYAFVIPVCIMNILQFFYIYDEWNNISVFILHSFYTFAIFNALLRTMLVIKNRAKFEDFMQELESLHTEIQNSGDSYMKEIVKKATTGARKISIFNLSASFLDVTGALFYPLFTENKVHPFGVLIPGLDMTAFPTYEIVYVLQISAPLVLTFMYMPFVSLFASFAMFGKAILKILQYRLRNLYSPEKSDLEIVTEVNNCVKYHNRIIRYVEDFNSLVTYICFIEFVLFSAILCFLLFALNILASWVNMISVCMYILTMLYVLFTYYWQANELLEESLKVADAVYDFPWFECSALVKKAIIMISIRSQKPLKIMVGNIYPMTLETFQTLLNASYSYFTVLRGVYNY